MSEKHRLPSGKRLHNHGTSPFLLGKLTISMAISNCYVKLAEGTHEKCEFDQQKLGLK